MTRRYCDICDRRIDHVDKAFSVQVTRVSPMPSTATIIKNEICWPCANRIADACDPPPKATPK